MPITKPKDLLTKAEVTTWSKSWKSSEESPIIHAVWIGLQAGGSG